MTWLSALNGLDAWSQVRVLIAAGVYACALMAVGSRLFLHVFPALPADEQSRVAGTGAVAALLGIVLVLLQWPLQAAYLGGSSLQAALDPVLLGMVYDSPQGDRLLLAVGGLALLLAATPTRHAPAWIGRLLGLAGIALVLLAFVQVGHTRGEPRLLLASLLALHLLAIAFWLAALPPLLRLAGSHDTAVAARALGRFGRIGLLIVPLLLVAGLILAWLLLGGIAPLFTTAYGQLLLGKLGLVALLLGLAALNKFRLVPALARGEDRARQALRRSILAESVLMAAVLLLTALFTTVASPRDGLAMTADHPVTTTTDGGPGWDASFSPYS